MLELQHLRKAYTPKIVPVKNINLTVQAGEFLTLLGPSGCGKSTILRLIAGLEPPSEGNILINGRNVTPLGPGDRNIAMVFQSYALYPHMTVYDNIASGLKLRQVPEAQIQQRINSVAQFLGLADLMARKPGQLSGGQRQRVAVARALVREPDVFLLDEPLSNLDALLREQVRTELKQLFASQTAPIIYVTHDQTEAMTLSSRIAVLNNGHLQQLDSPQTIYNSPVNQFVAGFIGSPQMTFLSLPVTHQSVTLGGAQIPLPMKTTGEVILGIRPEQVRLATAEDQGPTIHGEVFLVENLGMGKLVSVKLPDSPTPPPQGLLRGLLPAAQDYQVGEAIALALDPTTLHWFSPQTGEALRP